MEVKKRGWIEEIRDKGKIKFLVLVSDGEKYQITVKRGVVSDEIFSLTEKLTRQSTVYVEGDLLENSISKTGKEIIPKKLEIINLADPVLPLDPSEKTPAEMETKLDWRPLSLRTEKSQIIFRVQSAIVKFAQEFLYKNGFLQVFTPGIIGVPSEGGAEVFEVKYFDRKAYLRQDPQLHRELTVIGGLTRIFEIGPAWRAELSHTPRHLTEHRVIAVEKGFIKDECEIIDLEKNLMLHILKRLSEEYSKEIEKIGGEVYIPKKVPILEFPDVYDILDSFGKHFEFPEDYDRESEELLGKYVKENYDSDLFFVNKFPFAVKPFYVMRYDDKPEFARSVDMIYKGMEMSSGGEREHRYEWLVRNIKEKGLNIKNLEWFINHFKYGTCPLGGFAIGIERLTMKILNIKNIKEVVLYPRTPERLIP